MPSGSPQRSTPGDRVLVEADVGRCLCQRLLMDGRTPGMGAQEQCFRPQSQLAVTRESPGLSWGVPGAGRAVGPSQAARGGSCCWSPVRVDGCPPSPESQWLSRRQGFSLARRPRQQGQLSDAGTEEGWTVAGRRRPTAGICLSRDSPLESRAGWSLFGRLSLGVRSRVWREGSLGGFRRP